MNTHLILLSIPGLRDQDLTGMPRLNQLAVSGGKRCLSIDFPAVTWPSQATMLTGKRPNEHGVIANGFYWRDESRVEMWTAWNDKIESPQIWDLLKERDRSLTSAAWFPMLSKGCGADYVCMPAPVHNPDGSESMWCYTKPQEFYAELLERFGHFPLQHFWGPLANIKSTAWIVDSAVMAFERFHPNFFDIYLPHLDYASQKCGPDSPEAQQALVELDAAIGRLIDGISAEREVIWMAVSEYVISSVDQATYPNRILRETGMLEVTEGEERLIDFEGSAAWALVDHQFSHVFVRDRDPALIRAAAQAFSIHQGFDRVIVGDERRDLGLDHPRAGDLILISSPNSWQAYYWWLDDVEAPSFARSVDIHRKPGYDPVELFWDRESNGVPLQPDLVKGSHGLVNKAHDGGVFLSSQPWKETEPIAASAVCQAVLRQF